MRKIGIMGGTFDPIHIGHLILAENAYLQLELDKVVFMPSGNPPHKRKKIPSCVLQVTCAILNSESCQKTSRRFQPGIFHIHF